MNKELIGWYLYAAFIIGMFTVVLSVWMGNFQYIPYAYFDLYNPQTLPTNVFTQYMLPHLLELVSRGIIWGFISAFVLVVVAKYILFR